MVKSKNLSGEESKIVVSEVVRFRELVKNYKKLLTAIGKL